MSKRRPYLCDECGKEHRRCAGHRRKIRPLEPCGAQAMKGKETCRIHGATSKSGADHPNFRGGKRSVTLARFSAELAENYEAALADPEIESLHRDIALCDARQIQLLERLTADGGRSWTVAASRFEDLKEALQETKAENFQRALDGLAEVIRGGVADQAVWGELYGVMEQRRRLADTEGKNLERMHGMITAEQVTTLLAAVVYLINQNVKNRGTRQKIINGIQIIAQGDAGAQHRATSEVASAA